MINHNNDKNKIFPIKKTYQTLIIIILAIASISILFYNASHNFPTKFNIQTYLTWSVSQVLVLFGIVCIVVALYTLLIINTKNSSLKEFLTRKNILLIFIIFISISLTNYNFSLIGNTTSLIQNLETDFALISALFIYLFVFMAICFLLILRSNNKK